MVVEGILVGILGNGATDIIAKLAKKIGKHFPRKADEKKFGKYKEEWNDEEKRDRGSGARGQEKRKLGSPSTNGAKRRSIFN